MVEINPGEITYRISLDFENDNDQLLAISGNANYSSLKFESTADLIQRQLIPDSQLGDIPTTGIVQPGDSWVSIGNESTHNTQFSHVYVYILACHVCVESGERIRKIRERGMLCFLAHSRDLGAVQPWT